MNGLILILCILIGISLFVIGLLAINILVLKSENDDLHRFIHERLLENDKIIDELRKDMEDFTAAEYLRFSPKK